jgi:hypothetical protein
MNTKRNMLIASVASAATAWCSEYGCDVRHGPCFGNDSTSNRAPEQLNQQFWFKRGLWDRWDRRPLGRWHTRSAKIDVTGMPIKLWIFMLALVLLFVALCMVVIAGEPGIQ